MSTSGIKLAVALSVTLAFLHFEAAGEVLYSDNFDGYSSGSLPTGWTRYFNASSDSANNAVRNVTSYSSPNSFQVYGSHSSGFWAAHMTHPVDLATKSGVATLYARFKCSGDIETTQSGHYFELQFGFDNQSDGQGGSYGIITVGWGTKGDGIGEIGSAGGTRTLTYGVWHSVKIQLDLSRLKYRTWVDDSELGSETTVPARPGWLKLSSGGGRAWVDDVVLEYATTAPVMDRATLFWDCNQASGTSVSDSKGSNNGTLDEPANVFFTYSSDLGRYCIRKLASTTAGITPSSRPVNNPTFTIACWAKPAPENDAASGQFFLVDASTEKTYRVFTHYIHYQYSSSPPYPQRFGYFTGTGGWHHYVWANLDNGNGTANLRMFVDGVKLADTLLAANEYNSTVNVNQKFLVQRPLSAYYYSFIGDICKIAVFNNAALTDSEVTQLYALGGSNLIISNVRTSQRAGANLVDVTYDLSGNTAPVLVSVLVSTNGGTSYNIVPANLSGDGITDGVSAGTGRHIVWDAGADLPSRLVSQVRVKVLVPPGGGTREAMSPSFLLDTRYGPILLQEPFSYPNGPLVSVSGGKWLTHSGTTGQVNVVSGRIFLSQTNSEDVSAYLTGYPISTNSGKVLYAKFSVTFTGLPWLPGAHFAHFKDAGTGFRCRVWASTSNAPSGCLRLGIASSSLSPPGGNQLPLNLTLNRAYTVVMRYVVSDGASTLWVNPTKESDPCVSSTDSGSRITVEKFAFRETTGIGSLFVDNLVVGTTFDQVVNGTGQPYLCNLQASQLRGANTVEISYDLIWTNSLSVQISASTNGTTWNIPITRVSGDIGGGVVPGYNHKIIWNAGADWPNKQTASMIIRLTAGSSSSNSAPFALNTMNSWYVLAWADKDGDKSYDPGEELNEADVFYGSRTGNLIGQTTANGTLQINAAPKAGNSIFIRKAIANQPAVKTGHEKVDNCMFTLWLDSDVGKKDDEVSDGTWSDYTLSPDEEAMANAGIPVPIRLAHPIFEWHLVVATEVTNASFHDKLRAGFTNASHYLFDVTDGQMKFGKIAIYANVGQKSNAWKRADMIIFDVTNQRPITRNGTYWSNSSHIEFGTTWSHADPDKDAYFRAIVHEIGHYALNLGDEYCDGNYNETNWISYRFRQTNEVPMDYGFMDVESAIGLSESSEMSSYNDYLNDYPWVLSASTVTAQIWEHNLHWWIDWYPCWQWVEREFQKTYAGFPVEIVVPPYGYYAGRVAGSTSEDRSGPDRIREPYIPCEFPATTSGGLDPDTLLAARSPSPSGAACIQALCNGIPVGGAQIVRHPNGQERVNMLGLTDKQGRLKAYDVAAGDVLVAGYRGREGRLTLDAVVPLASIQISIGHGVRLSPEPQDEGSGGNLGSIVSAGATVGSTNWLGIQLLASASLADAPTVVVHPDDDAGVTVNMMIVSPSNYAGAVELGDAVGGTVEVSCEAAGSGSISSADQFALGGVTLTNSATVYSRDGWVDLHLPAGSTTTNAAALIYAGYAPAIMPTGFDKVKVGPVYSLSLGGGTCLNGQFAVVNAHYREADLVGVDETTIQLYRWNEAATAWNVTPSGISPDQDVLSATLTNLGVFALFADSTSDVTPPGTISDLAATSGTNGWRVNLHWTATGDDGGAGTATSYVLKFSESEITSNNWDSCATMDVGSAPHGAGTVEGAAIQMPDPGVTYYFAIRAQDEAGNVGPMSNVASARSYQLDSDGDGMPDQWEATYGLNPTNSADADLDADGDGLTNRQEYDLGTNPAVWETDGDGMSDKWEVDNGFNPNSIEDRDADNDHDGLSNYQEYLNCTDPNDADTDHDGMPDKWELDHGFCPFSTSGTNGPDADSDGDGLSNQSEYVADTNPQDVNSFLHFSGASISSNMFQLQWQGGVLATQRLWQATSLKTNAWAEILTVTPPTPITNSWEGSVTNRARFFRIEAFR